MTDDSFLPSVGHVRDAGHRLHSEKFRRPIVPPGSRTGDQGKRNDHLEYWPSLTGKACTRGPACPEEQASRSRFFQPAFSRLFLSANWVASAVSRVSAMSRSTAAAQVG